MKPFRTDLGGASEPDENDGDARVMQRAMSNLRDRMRVQEDEIDTLRAMIRAGQKPGAGDQMAQIEARLDQYAEKWAEKFAEQAGFADRLRNEVLPRVNSLETEIMDQARTIEEMHEVAVRTDENLQRLLVEIDRLVSEVARRPEPSPPLLNPPVLDPVVATEPQTLPDFGSSTLFGAEEETRFRWRVPAILLAVLVCLFLAGWGISSLVSRSRRPGTVADSAGSLSPIEQARIFESEKNYAKAEAIYKDVLKKDPNNNDVIRHLASVLFRQDKFEESATELKKLNGADSTSP
jgi:uncharacterized coiled-coil protein SlyX